MKGKVDALQVLKLAWVAETVGVILIGVAAMAGGPGWVSAYLRMLPLWSVLIGAQGAAAYSGPLLKGRINGKVS